MLQIGLLIEGRRSAALPRGVLTGGFKAGDLSIRTGRYNLIPVPDDQGKRLVAQHFPRSTCKTGALLTEIHTRRLPYLLLGDNACQHRRHSLLERVAKIHGTTVLASTPGTPSSGTLLSSAEGLLALGPEGSLESVL